MAHRTVHKVDCKSSLIKEAWRPALEFEKRSPAFMINDEELVPAVKQAKHGAQKYLWGNVPAVNVISCFKMKAMLFWINSDFRLQVRNLIILLVHCW